jgi:hypothetical protein
VFLLIIVSDTESISANRIFASVILKHATNTIMERASYLSLTLALPYSYPTPTPFLPPD